MVASGARINESGTRALVEIAGVSIGLVKALGGGELLPNGAKPYETGVALAVERHTHTPDERHTVVVKGTMSQSLSVYTTSSRPSGASGR